MCDVYRIVSTGIYQHDSFLEFIFSKKKTNYPSRAKPDRMRDAYEVRVLGSSAFSS